MYAGIACGPQGARRVVCAFGWKGLASARPNRKTSPRGSVLACPPCTCERHHRQYATTDSQGARSRPQRPMPLWLWQEVQALPWSTEIVALTCVPRIACDPRRPSSSVHGKLVVQHRPKTKNVGTLPPLSSLNFLTIRGCGKCMCITKTPLQHLGCGRCDVWAHPMPKIITRSDVRRHRDSLREPACGSTLQIHVALADAHNYCSHGTFECPEC